MQPPVRLVPFGAAATEALVDTIRAAKADDPLAKVTVAVASAYVGITARRAATVALGGLVDVQVLPLPALIEAIGAPRLRAAGRRPSSTALRAGALRRALVEGDGDLAAVAHHRATQRSAGRTVADVRGAGLRAFDALRDHSPRAAEIARVVHRYRGVLGDFYDDADLASAAVDALHAGDASVRDLGTIIVHLPGDADEMRTAVLRALVAHGDARVHLGLTGDVDADEPVIDLAARLGGHEFGAAEHPATVRVYGAPDPAAEVAVALRVAAEALDAGTPLHRIVIAYRLASPYARTIVESVRLAGWSWSGPSAQTLGDTVAGRALAGALTLAEHDFPRDAVAAFLAAAPIPDSPGGEEAPAHRWDVLSREAGIVGGVEQWHDRLAAHRERVVARRDAVARSDGSEVALEKLDADLDEIVRLDAFITWIAELLAAPEAPTWQAYAAWVHGLLDVLVPGLGWPDAEARAAQDLLARVDGLGALDALSTPPPTLDDFRNAIDDELATPLGPVGRVGDGLLVLPLASAVGVDADLVIVVGANEGRFPPRGGDDPLLPDAIRSEITGLPTRLDRERRETQHRLAIMAGGREVVVTWSRSDPRSGRELHPARWVVQLVREQLGPAITAADLATLDTPTVSTSASFAALVTHGPGTPTSLAEFDLAALALAAPGIDAHPAIVGSVARARGLFALRRREAPELSAFDGYVGSLDALLPDPQRTLSPTALEQWSTCPRRYLFDRLLRAGVVERPEGIDDISPMDRGTLVHGILESFVKDRDEPIDPDEPWSDDDLARLETVIEAQFQATIDKGLTGRTLLWQLSDRRIRGWVRDWLATDERTRAAYGVRPELLELTFGGTEPGDDDALEIAIDGRRSFRLRGQIDRVDRSPDGSVLVVHDYKTGSAKKYLPIEPKARSKAKTFDPTLSGIALQLPIYALAAARHFPGATRIHADYWMVGGSESGRQIGYDFDDRHEAEFMRVMTHIADGIEQGVFPGDPGDEDFFGFENCSRCAFDRVCPRDRDVQFSRKLADGALEPYLALAPVAVPDESPEESS